MFENSMSLPAALSGRFFFFFSSTGFFACCESSSLSLSPTCTVVGGRRFQPTSGHLDSISVSVLLVQQQTEPLVEESKVLTAFRTIGRGAESVAGCKPVSLRVDGCCCVSGHVPTSFCCCGCVQLFSVVGNVGACFCDLAARMLSFVLQDS